MLLSAVAFTAAFAGMIIALIRVHKHYRGAGFSIDKARKEFSDGVMANPNVQQVLNKKSRCYFDFLRCGEVIFACYLFFGYWHCSGFLVIIRSLCSLGL